MTEILNLSMHHAMYPNEGDRISTRGAIFTLIKNTIPVVVVLMTIQKFIDTPPSFDSIFFKSSET